MSAFDDEKEPIIEPISGSEPLPDIQQTEQQAFQMILERVRLPPEHLGPGPLMPDPPFLYVALFIAPDGDFVHVTPFNMDWRMIQRVDEKQAAPGPDEDQWQLQTKMFARHTLAIPKEEADKVQIGPWPSLAWDEFLRRVIRDLEAKGDAPWKTKSK